jgi:hypothetical protein
VRFWSTYGDERSPKCSPILPTRRSTNFGSTLVAGNRKVRDGPTPPRDKPHLILAAAFLSWTIGHFVRPRKERNIRTNTMLGRYVTQTADRDQTDGAQGTVGR